MSLRTPLCDLLEIDVPVICALRDGVLPAVEIMARTVAEAEEALKHAGRYFGAEQH